MRVLSNLGLLLASLALALGATELGLRIAGYRFQPTLESIEFGWPNREVRQVTFVSDPDLFWVWPGFEKSLEQLRGAHPDLLLLGDSVTAWGRWPHMLFAALQNEHSDRTLVTGMLACPGWSSFQGLQLLRRDVLPLHPRALTLWFGWNDHWRGMGVDDAGVHAISRPLTPWLRKLRLEQLVLEARLAWHIRQSGAASERVAPGDFRANLTAMVTESRAAGSVPVLVTAPSGHRPGAEPAHLSPRWIEDLSQLIPLHQRYVAIVREVAAAEHSPLCDLAAGFEALSDAERQAAFAMDGIHLTLDGDRRAAAYLLECFRADPALLALWPPR